MSPVRKPSVIFGVVLLVASLVIGIAPNPVGAQGLPGARVFVSSSSAGSVDGVGFTKGDILVYDGTADSWAMFFDGSQAGLGSANIDGFDITDSDPTNSVVELTFAGVTAVPGVGQIDDSDLVIFTGTTGATTSGSFTVLFDGSDVGLTSGGEDIDAVTTGATGPVFSILGSGSAPATSGGNLPIRDEDLVSFAGTTGPATSGDFATLFDGTDVGLGTDVVAAWIDPATQQIYGSTLGNHNLGGLTGDGDDIFVFTGTTGPATSGTFALFFDGDQHRFGGEQIDGLHIEIGPQTDPGSADLATAVTAVTSVANPGDTISYAVAVTNGGPDPATNVVVSSAMPAGLTFVSTTGCPLDPNGLPCTLGSIAPSDTASFTVTATVNQGTAGTVTISAEASASSSDPNLANNTASDGFQVSGPPAASDDGPQTNSTPGSLYHTDIDTPYTLAAPGLLANDNLGNPAGTITGFSGGNLGGAVTDNPAGQATTIGATGSLQVNTDGSLDFTPDTGFTGPFTFSYRLANNGGFSDATVTIYVGPRPVAAGNLVYLTSAGNGTVDGITFEDEDITVYNTVTDTWAMFFDGSDLGLGLADINGFTIQTLEPDPIIHLTFVGPTVVPGLAARADDSDIVTFTATTTGDTTAGTFELLIDGSDLGLSSGGEDIDALASSGDDLVMSTWGSHNASGVTGSDEDLLTLTTTGTGAVTTGTLDVLLDGSDVGLTAEDIWAADINQDTGDIYGSSLNGFNVPGLTGDGDDIFVFTPTTTGTTTTGTFSTFFDGDTSRYGGNQINGLHITPASTPPDNRPPTITTSGPVQVDENQTGAVDVDATDPDGDTENGGGLAYSFAGGVDDALFNLDINTGEVTFKIAPDFEDPTDTNADNTYDIQATVTDSGGLTGTQAIQITVINIDEPPTAIDDVATVDEDDPATTINVLANDTDPDSGPIAIDSVTQPANGQVTLTNNGTDLTYQPNPNYCNDDLPKDSFTYTLTPGASTATVAVTVTCMNDAPNFTSPNAVSVQENQTNGIDVDATDPEGDTENGGGLTYTIDGGDDAGLFSIDTNSGEVTFDDAPDAEIPGDANTDNVYLIEVTVTDSGGETNIQAIAITVTDLDENQAPTITTSSPVQADENQIEAADADATDPDGDTENGGGLTYTIDGGDDAGLFSIDSNTGEVTFLVAPDFEDPTDTNTDNTYQIEVTVTDSGGLTGTKAIQIAVVNIDEPPTAIDDIATVDEGDPATAIDVLANDTDVDGGPIAITSVTQPANGEVVITSSGADLTYQPNPNYCNDGTPTDDFTYTLTPGATTATVAVTVTCMNDAPDFTTPAGIEVVENSPQVEIEATDDNDSTGNGLTYTITGGADADKFSGFTITATPAAFLDFVTPPDFENPDDANTDRVYEVQVTVTDTGTLTDVLDLNVTITDVEDNTAPSITSPNTAAVLENQTEAVDVNATDPEGDTEGAGLGFALTGGADQVLFSIDTDSGALTFNTAPDFENPGDADSGNDYQVEVTVTDSGGAAQAQTITITVLDAEEAAGFAVGFGGELGSSQDQGYDIAVDSTGNVLSVGLFWGTADFDPDPETELLHTSVGNWNAYLAKYTPSGQLAWAHSFGTSNDVGRGVAVDDEGSAVITGAFGGTADFDPDPDNVVELAASDGAAFVAKFDSGGDLLWAHGIGGSRASGVDVAVGHDGNVFIAGTFSNTADFDPSEDGTANLSAGGRNDVFLLKLTASGEFQWVRQYDSGGAWFDLAGDVGVDDSGNVYLNGVWDTVSTQSSSDFFLTKVDPAGNEVWLHTIARSSSEAEVNLAVDPQGNSYVTANFSGSIDLDPSPVAANLSGSSSAFFIAKYDNDGSFVRANQLNGGFGGVTRGVGVNASGEVVATGRFRGALDFDPGSGTFVVESSGVGSSVYLAKFDADGGLSWVKAVGGPGSDDGQGAAIDDFGNVYGTGRFDTSARFSTGDADVELLSNVNSDAFVAKLSAAAPAIGTRLTLTVPENQTDAVDLQSLDDADNEGSGLTYSLDGGADENSFELNAETGLLAFNPPPDFEIPADTLGDNRYEVKVRVTDSTGLFHAVSLVIDVTDVLENQAPTITTTSPVQVDENQTGAVDVDSTDPDGDIENGGGLTYAITGGADQTLLSIDGNTGQVTFNDPPDFEDADDADEGNDYEIEVTVTDSDGLTDLAQLTILVQNLDEFAVVADNYESLGNVGIGVEAADGLLSNDVAEGPTPTVSAVQASASNLNTPTATDQGGVVVVESSGAFVYSPPPGFKGDDTFDYTFGDGLSSQSTEVTIDVDEMIWFVDSSNSSGIEFGTLDFPFSSIDGAEGFNSLASDGPGDSIYISGSGDYNGTLALKADQVVVGQGSSTSIENVAGFTLPSFSRPLPAVTGATRPGISGSPGIVLASGNTIRGLDLTATSGFRMVGLNPGTLNAAEMTVGVGNGRSIALEVEGSAQASINLSSIALTDNTSTQGQDGISIVSKDDASVAVTLADITLTSTNGTPGVLLLGSGSSQMTYRVSGSTLSNANADWTLRTSATDSSDLDGEVTGSEIRSSAGSPSPLQFAAVGNGTNVSSTSGNSIIALSALSGVALGTTAVGLANVQATLVDNNIDLGPAVTFGIAMTGTGPGHMICLDAQQNDVIGDGGVAFGIAANDPIVLEGLVSSVAALAQGAPLLNSWWTDGGNTNTTPEISFIGNRNLDAVGRAIPGTCASPSL